jgi:hypothetical protein
MDKGGTVAVAAQGTLIHKSGGSWRATPTPTHSDLRAVAVSGSTAVAAGDDGAVLRIDPSAPGSYAAIAVPQPDDLKAVAIAGTQLYLGAPQGRVWRAASISAPSYTALNHNSGAIHGFANNSGSITAVGAGSLLHRFSGSTRMVVNDLFTPTLHATWFQDALTGYVVGAANTLRYTDNGGERWQVLPLGGALTTLRAVHGNAAGKALAVGNNTVAIALDLQGASYPVATTGLASSTTLNGVAVAESGAAVVVGTDGSVGRYAQHTANGTWSTQSVSGKAFNTVWAFPRYMADVPGTDTENSVEDFLLAGDAGYTHMVKYTPHTGVFTIPWTATGAASGLSGNVKALWFHDRVGGLALVSGGSGASQIFREDDGPVGHGSAFSW